MIGWDVIFNVERVKQSLLPTRQLSHHAANPPAGRWPDFAAGQAGDLLFQQNRPEVDIGVEIAKDLVRMCSPQYLSVRHPAYLDASKKFEPLSDSLA